MQGIYQDIPRLYTAIAEWGACVLQITVLNRRLRGWQLFSISAAALMLLYLCICCREKLMTTVAACARAFLLAEFAASLEWQLHCYMLMRLGSLARPVQWGLAALTYGLIFLPDIVWKKSFIREMPESRSP